MSADQFSPHPLAQRTDLPHGAGTVWVGPGHSPAKQAQKQQKEFCKNEEVVFDKRFYETAAEWYGNKLKSPKTAHCLEIHRDSELYNQKPPVATKVRSNVIQKDSVDYSELIMVLKGLQGKSDRRYVNAKLMAVLHTVMEASVDTVLE